MRQKTDPATLLRIKATIMADNAGHGRFWTENRNMARGVVLQHEGVVQTVPQMARMCRYLEEVLACDTNKTLANWPENGTNTLLSAFLSSAKHPRELGTLADTKEKAEALYAKALALYHEEGKTEETDVLKTFHSGN